MLHAHSMPERLPMKSPLQCGRASQSLAGPWQMETVAVDDLPDSEDAHARRTTVLLGAGASRDADLPVTAELAQELVKLIDAAEPHPAGLRIGPMHTPLVQALHVVYGAMVAHAAELGASPLDAVNVERLVSAVRLLSERRTHEAAPFVASWRASVEEVDSRPGRSRRSLNVGQAALRGMPRGGRATTFTSEQQAAIQGALQNVQNGLDEIGRSVKIPLDGETFRMLEQQLLAGICQLLSEPKTVEYLAPLLELARTQPGGLDITTLNYDTTVEKASADAGMPVDTGLDQWTPGRPILFPHTDGTVNLIKPHGSIDWARVVTSANERMADKPLIEYRYVQIDHLPTRQAPGQVTPLIVVGDREKLESDGPTLPLLQAFEDALWDAENIVVIGYSFGDQHINRVIRNWLAADTGRTIVILDPGWPQPTPSSMAVPQSFTETLSRIAALPLESTPGRVVIIRKTAKDGLAEALHATPLGITPEPITVTLSTDCIEITNNAYDIEELTVMASPSLAFSAPARDDMLRASPDQPGSAGVTFHHIARGDSVRAYAGPDLHARQVAGGLQIRGFTATHAIRLTAGLPPTD